MRHCPKCGYPITEKAKFCPHCGFNQDVVFSHPVCPSCGADRIPSDVFCDQCGEKLPDVGGFRVCENCGDFTPIEFSHCVNCGANPSASSHRLKLSVPADRDPFVALILCLFLGLFGMHRFYLDDVVAGRMYVILSVAFCWTIIAPVVVLILCIIDFFRITGSIARR